MKLCLNMHDVKPESWQRISDAGFKNVTVAFEDLTNRAQAAMSIVGRGNFHGSGVLRDQTIVTPTDMLKSIAD